MSAYKILLVDDDPTVRFGIRKALEQKGFSIEEAESCHEGEERFRVISPDAVILDHMLPDGIGLDLLLKMKSIDSSIPVIMLTGHGTIDIAVQAIKEGADHFLTKPLRMNALSAILDRVMEHQRIRRQQIVSKSKRDRESLNPFLGTSDVIQNLKEQSDKVVATDRTVMIWGETGTGKSTLARWLHYNGPRAEEPFVEINCAGLSKEFLETELFGHEKGAFTGAVASKSGLLDVANRGTLFLDEIGDMDLQIQPKLLKVLEEKQFRRLGDVRDRRVDIRLIAATHQDLSLLVKEKKFRSDLYFRINTIPLTTPSLRDRKEDIPIIARHLLNSIASNMGYGEMKLMPAAMRALQAYSWPGNIRELRTILDRAVLLSRSSTLDVSDLRFDHIASGMGPCECHIDLTLDEVEHHHIERILQLERGSVEKAANRLGIARSSLYYKMKRYGLT